MIARSTGYRVSSSKDASISQLIYMPHLLSNDKSGKMIDIIEFKYFINGAAFMGNPVSIFDKKIDQGLNYHN